MRRIAVVFACALALAASACASLEGRYFREGIGTDLYWSGLPEASRLEDLYIGYVCQQAGLPVVRESDYVLCATAFGPGEWSLFFQAGMNDIDRRCDAYLAWLDDKRRAREPILKQIADMSAATAGILGAANVGATPITIVGLAFGLAANTFTNISSRLLLDVDHSTVQAVVLGNQADFRANNVNVTIDNRPAAIYLLRRYLRLCMPYTIEMSINTTITIYHRDPEALATTPLLLRTSIAARLWTAQRLRESIPPGGSRGRLPYVGGQSGGPPEGRKSSDNEFATGARTTTELNIPKSILKVIQANLCVTPTGRFDDNATRPAIQHAKLGNRLSGPTRYFKNDNDQINDAVEKAFLLRQTSFCPDNEVIDRGYLTTFEKFALPTAKSIQSLQESLASSRCYPALIDHFTGKFDQLTRRAIKVAKEKLTPERKDGLTDLNTATLNEKSYTAILSFCH